MVIVQIHQLRLWTAYRSFGYRMKIFCTLVTVILLSKIEFDNYTLTKWAIGNLTVEAIGNDYFLIWMIYTYITPMLQIKTSPLMN